MPSYKKQENDRDYRIVFPTAQVNPEFTKFQDGGQIVEYSKEAILEVTKSDGSNELICSLEPTSVAYAVNGCKIRIDAQVPLGRLWLRRADGLGICYKVPVDLPVVDGRREVLVPAGTENIELFLDPFAAKAYILERK